MQTAHFRKVAVFILDYSGSEHGRVVTIEKNAYSLEAEDG
jgi:hypothetical protein